jgi:hypothetical protein
MYDEPMQFVAMDAQFRTSNECFDLGVPFVPCDLFASLDEEANGVGGTDAVSDGDNDGVECSQYRSLTSEAQNKDASQRLSEDFVQEDDSDMQGEGDLLGDDDLPRSDDDLTRTGRELLNTLNSSHIETEVPDGVSRWGEPDDEQTKEKGRDSTAKATASAMKAFQQWRIDTKRNAELPLAGMKDFDMAKVMKAYAAEQRKQDGGEYKANNIKTNMLSIQRHTNEEINAAYQAGDGTEDHPHPSPRFVGQSSVAQRSSGSFRVDRHDLVFRVRECRPSSEPPSRSVLPANPRDYRGGPDARRGESIRGLQT